MPRSLEFAIVIGAAFGLFILNSLASVGAEPTAQSLGDESLYGLVLFEVAVLAAIGIFLTVRGWTFRNLTASPGWRSLVWGIGLAMASFVLVFAARAAFFRLFPGMAPIASSYTVEAAALGWGAIIAVCIVNSMYEELLVTAYTMTFWAASRSIWFALNISVALRLSYHLYQGPVSIPDILPIGLLFAYHYARTRDVWALVIAHGTINFISLSTLVNQS